MIACRNSPDDAVGLSVPWKNGALYVPSINWKQDDARELVCELISWLRWADTFEREMSGILALQSELAERLRERKAANIAATTPDVVATGNIGCMTQLADALDAPIVHTVELLDWATGGPKPSAIG